MNEANRKTNLRDCIYFYHTNQIQKCKEKFVKFSKIEISNIMISIFATYHNSLSLSLCSIKQTAILSQSLHGTIWKNCLTARFTKFELLWPYFLQMSWCHNMAMLMRAIWWWKAERHFSCQLSSSVMLQWRFPLSVCTFYWHSFVYLNCSS